MSSIRCISRPSRVMSGCLLLWFAICSCGDNLSRHDPAPGGQEYPVTVAMQGAGSGDVESLDTAVLCGARCQARYPGGSTVTLHAVTARGSVFDGWQGPCSGTGTCVITVDQAERVIASFSPAEPVLTTNPWLNGDGHVHTDHSSDGSAPRQVSGDKGKGDVAVNDQIGQATRQGLDFLPITDHRTYDQHYDPLWESSSLLLVRGEEANGSPHAIALGGVDTVVQGAAHPDRAPFAHVQQSVWDAHAQGATWSIAHPDDGETNADGTPNANASVQGADLVETLNRASNPEKEIDYAENRWNRGFRFGCAGASDDHFQGYFWLIAGPGTPTTSVLASDDNERGVLDAVRAGRTHVSLGGAVVTLATDLRGKGYVDIGGDEVFVPAGTPGHLRISVRRAAGFDVLLYRKPGRSAGDPLATFHPVRDDETYIQDITAGAAPDWYRVEVRGPTVPFPPGSPIPLPPQPPVEVKALVSPLFISPGPVDATPEVAIPAEASQDDGALRAVGARGEFAGFPDLAADAGALHLVAEVHGDATSAVVYRRRDARGVWSDAGRVLSGRGLARFPRVAATGNDVWVTWEEDAVHVPHRPVIHLRHSADGGLSWQETRTVRSLEGRAEHPDLVVTPAGKPILVWQEIQQGQPFDILVQEIGTDAQPRNLTREGKAIVAGTADDTRSPRYPASVLPAIAIAADGRVAVTWQDNRTDLDPLWTGGAGYGHGTDPDNWQIQVAVRDASGTWAPAVSLGADDMADRHPDIAFGSDGNLVVVWETKTLKAAGANLSVLAATSTDGGATFSAPTALAPLATTMSQRPRLGVDHDGALRAVWYDSRSADWRWRVMTAVFRNATWEDGVLLNGPGINTWPATAGGAIVFASTRNATRLQRDRTQQIFVLPAR